MKNYKYSDDYHFPIDEMGDKTSLEERIKNAKIKNKSTENAFRRVLKFLYLADFAESISRNTVKTHLHRLTKTEQIMANKLSYRASNSKMKYRYGINSVLAVKKAKYKCKVCGEKDVRCLEIDHVGGRDKASEKAKKNPYKVKDFQILCTNHHRIKTVVEGQEN